MKGIYPAIVYALFFVVGITIFFLVYSFTTDFINEKEFSFEKAQSESLCDFLKILKNKSVEVELDLGDYRIESNPLRIVGLTTNYCNLSIIAKGNCSGICKIKSYGSELIFS